MSLQSRLALTVMATLAVPLTVAAVLLTVLLPGQLSRHVNTQARTARDTLRALVTTQCHTVESTAQAIAAAAAAAATGSQTGLRSSSAITDPVTRGSVDAVLLADPKGTVKVSRQRTPVQLATSDPSLVSPAALLSGADCSAGPTAGALVAHVRIVRPNGTPLGTAVAATWLDERTLAAWNRALRADGVAVAGGRLGVHTPGTAGSAAAGSATAATSGKVVSSGDYRVAALALRSPGGTSVPYALAVTLTAPSYGWLPWLLALAVLLVVGLSGLLCKEIARAATRPLGELDAAAGRIARGDFDGPHAGPQPRRGRPARRHLQRDGRGARHLRRGARPQGGRAAPRPGTGR